ncbi:Uncharacterized protein ALO38_01166 [Pseudomonas coronafaciens pv. zizaniae]|nr:Uncharacterized protein ALO38_01166 [Pseudomonas coronafaciens pv. zizaniae]
MPMPCELPVEFLCHATVTSDIPSHEIRCPMSSTKNPCISLCKFDDDICLGCGRSKREIKAWKKLEKDDKRSVLEESAKRLAKFKTAGRKKKK